MRSKKMKPGKLSGPSHKNGGILLEAEGGEYIIKKSSVNKIGKEKLDKINKDGKLPVMKKGGKIKKDSPKEFEKWKEESGFNKGHEEWRFKKELEKKRAKKLDLESRRKKKPRPPKPTKKGLGSLPIGGPEKKSKGGSVGESIKTYSSGGYVEGK